MPLIHLEFKDRLKKQEEHQKTFSKLEKVENLKHLLFKRTLESLFKENIEKKEEGKYEIIKKIINTYNFFNHEKSLLENISIFIKDKEITFKEMNVNSDLSSFYNSLEAYKLIDIENKLFLEKKQIGNTVSGFVKYKILDFEFYQLKTPCFIFFKRKYLESLSFDTPIQIIFIKE